MILPPSPLPCYSFEDAIDAVRNRLVDRAIIPIENSQAGRVADMHFLLPESGLFIVGEHFLSIRHGLMSKGLAPVSRAVSHIQALAQCRHWLRSRGILPIAHADTAGAAAWVADSDEPGLAAIAPPHAADIYGLTLHETSIEDAAHNCTRFVILARTPAAPAPGVPLMTTMIFDVRNTTGSLYKALGSFATNGVNLTKVESYQDNASFTATRFYTDVEGGPGCASFDAALDELAFHALHLRILGSYPLARSGQTGLPDVNRTASAGGRAV